LEETACLALLGKAGEARHPNILMAALSYMAFIIRLFTFHNKNQ
jgi:hypothetical protein